MEYDEIIEMLNKLSTQEIKELTKDLERLDELRKNKKNAPPSDDDFLAALGPCGK